MNASVDEKIKRVEEELRIDIANMNAANMLALYYYFEAMYEVALSNPDNALGALLILGSMGNQRGTVSFLTGVRSIELHDGSQAPFISTETGELVWPNVKEATKLLEENKIQINVNHPLYSEAKAYAEGLGGNITAADLLAGYNEHIFPQSKVFAAAYIAIEKHIDKALKHPELEASSKHAFRDEIGSIIDQFDLYIASAYTAKKFDDKSGFGKVSEAKEFRIVLLDNSLRESFYDVESGKKTAERLAEGLRTRFDKKLSISEETVDNAKQAL